MARGEVPPDKVIRTRDIPFSQLLKRNDCLHSVHQKRYTTITQATAKYGYVANTVAKWAYEELHLLGYHFAEHPDIDPNNYGSLLL